MGTAPRQLPADFNDWDAPTAAPTPTQQKTLPANFTDWDASAPIPSTEKPIQATAVQPQVPKQETSLFNLDRKKGFTDLLPDFLAVPTEATFRYLSQRMKQFGAGMEPVGTAIEQAARSTNPMLKGFGTVLKTTGQIFGEAVQPLDEAEIGTLKRYEGKGLATNPELRTDPVYMSRLGLNGIASVLAYMPTGLAAGKLTSTALTKAIPNLAKSRPWIANAAQVLAGTTTGSALETMVNATDNYDEAKSHGAGEDIAQKVFWQTIPKDFAVTFGTNLAQYVVPTAKNPVLRAMLWPAKGAPSEGMQEVWQGDVAHEVLSENVGAKKIGPRTNRLEDFIGGFVGGGVGGPIAHGVQRFAEMQPQPAENQQSPLRRNAEKSEKSEKPAPEPLDDEAYGEALAFTQGLKTKNFSRTKLVEEVGLTREQATEALERMVTEGHAERPGTKGKNKSLYRIVRQVEATPADPSIAPTAEAVGQEAQPSPVLAAETTAQAAEGAPREEVVQSRAPEVATSEAAPLAAAEIPVPKTEQVQLQKGETDEGQIQANAEAPGQTEKALLTEQQQTSAPVASPAAQPEIDGQPEAAGAAGTAGEVAKFRHDIAKADVQTGAMNPTLKSDASKGASAVFHWQGDIGQHFFDATATVNGEKAKPSEWAQSLMRRYKAAEKAGYKRTNYRMGKLGTVWVMEKEGRILTERGADELTAGRVLNEAAAPVEREAMYPLVRSLSQFIQDLPETTRGNFGSLVSAVNRSPLGEKVQVRRNDQGRIEVVAIVPGKHGPRIFEPDQKFSGGKAVPLESSPERFIAKLKHLAETPEHTGAGGWAVHDREADAAVLAPASNALQAKLGENKAAKLRKSAEGLSSQIEAKRNPVIANQNITARRSRIAGNMAAEAESLERTQKQLNALANLHDSGNVPPILKRISSRAALEDLQRRHDERGKPVDRPFPTPSMTSFDVREILERSKGAPGTAEGRRILEGLRYADGPRFSMEQLPAIEKMMEVAEKRGWFGKYVRTRFAPAKRLAAAGITKETWYEALDAVEALGVKKSAPTKEQKIKELERDLLGTNIEGFFPTPKPVIEQMMAKAEIEPGMAVLEPSAGKGDIADAVVTGAKVTTIEPVQRLRDILQVKGHEVTEDRNFLEHKGEYDRIVMNPPFERGQDMEHVQHAYSLLKPGGRVVAIMSEGSFFRNDKKAAGFREWLESVGGDSEKLDGKAFTGKEAFRQTGVATRMVVINKPAAKPAPQALTPKAESPTIKTDARSGESRKDETLPRPAPASRRVGTPTSILVPGDTADVRDAVDALEYANAHGLKNLDDMQAQSGLFGETPEFSERAIALAKTLQQGTNTIRKAFNIYAKDADIAADPTASMFGTPEAAESFEAAFQGKPKRAGDGIVLGSGFGSLQLLYERIFENKPPDTSGPIPGKLVRALRVKQRKFDMPDPIYRRLMEKSTGKTSTKQLTADEAERFIQALTAHGVETLGMSKFLGAARAVHSPSWWLALSEAGAKIYQEAENRWFEQDDITKDLHKRWMKANKGVSKAERLRIGLYRDVRQLLEHYEQDYEKVGKIMGKAGYDPADIPAIADKTYLDARLAAVNERYSKIFEWTRKKGVAAGFLDEEQKFDSYLPFYYDAFFKLKPGKMDQAAVELAHELGIPERLAKQILERATSKNVKFGSFDMERLGWLLPGMRDPEARFEIYSKGFARKMAVSGFLKVANKLYPKIADPQLKQMTFEYINQYAGRPTSQGSANDARIAGWLTSLQYMAKIGFNLWSPLLNLTQTVVNTAPYAGLGVTATAAARATASVFLPKHLNPFRRDLVRLAHGGVLDSFEGKFERPVFHGAREQVQRSASYLFTKAEAMNRATAYLAGLELAKREGLKGEKAVQRARAVVRITQFYAGRVDAPLYSRTPIGKVLLQFKTFTFKEIEFIRQLNPQQKMAFAAWSAAIGGPASLGILAALKAFAPDWDVTEWVEQWQESMNLAAFLHMGNLTEQMGIFTVPGLEDLGKGQYKARMLQWFAGPSVNGVLDLIMASGRFGKDREKGAAWLQTLIRGWVPGGVEWLRVYRAMQEADSPNEAVQILINTAEKKTPAGKLPKELQ